MTIDPKKLIFNQPVLKIREIVRYLTQLPKILFPLEGILEYVSKVLNLSELEAKEIFDMLIKEQYLTMDMQKRDESYCYYFTLTLKGYLLAISKANPEISVSKAKLLVSELRQRVNELNNNEKFAYKVEKLKVLGSYSLKHDGLRDIDVAIQLKQRIEGDAFQQKKEERIDFAWENGRHFPTLIDQYQWPVREVMMFLNTRKKGLNLHFEIT
jgi:hypothetical protein